MHRSSSVRSRLYALACVVAVGAFAAGCAQPDPHVVLPEQAIGEPAFVATVVAHTGSPVVAGNSVELLLNGDQFFPAMLEAIRGARETINYAQYSWADGPVSRDITEALAERCRAGVAVNLLLDAVGTAAMPTEYIDAMRSAGCRVEHFRPVSRAALHRFNYRNHRRVLVVDGRVGFTGGSGVSAKWMGDGRTKDHWRDTDARVRGPVVAFLQGIFADSWRTETGIVLGGPAHFPGAAPVEGGVRAQVVRSSPGGGSFDVYTMYLLAISAARRTINMTNPYFVPDTTVQEALLSAARRGVRVTVLVPGEIDHNLVRQASRRGFGPLLLAGIRIHEYRASLLHAKTMVVDGEWATVGSTNIDNRSFALNDEMNLVVYDRAFAARLDRVFAEDLEHAVRVDYDAWRARPLRDRIVETLALPIRDLL
ncbi:MAG TPA: cardiolipin synthase [Candidatus Limnocylindria bacterium]|nr:cardiolipin synthase [Candidatus Limnocylindria bacterium]